MSAEEEECPECPPPPSWVLTFADLMGLLMSFFVLLLSFSETDSAKYKEIAGSMANAFGVQNELEFKGIPRGTSIIAREFSPGRPKPTPVNEVRQSTTDMTKTKLKDDRGDSATSGAADKNKADKGAGLSKKNNQSPNQAISRDIFISLQDVLKQVEVTLEAQIESGMLEVESNETQVTIRIKEKGSFPSGSADLRPEFAKTLKQIHDSIKNIPGRFRIEGHTDDLAIEENSLRSNWDLSAMRAVSVVQELLKYGQMDPKRMQVVGLANTQPIVPNEDALSRAKNRRVEIVIQVGAEDQNMDGIDVVESDALYDNSQNEINPNLYEQPPEFEFESSEIF
jgi:chemotaxis protein MotB